MIEIEYQFIGFLGSCMYILITIFEYMNQTSIKFKKKLKSDAAKFVICIILGQILVFMDEHFYRVFVDIKANHDLWDYYVDHQEVISFIEGLFSIVITRMILTKVQSKIKKL